MKNLTDYSTCLSRSIKYFLLPGLLFLLFSADRIRAQPDLTSMRYVNSTSFSNSTKTFEVINSALPDTTRNASSTSYPDPKQVMYKSLMIPGWGQVVNEQIWKVPVIYGLMAGLTYYSIRLNKRYHDYRAAYYNATHTQTSKQPYGPTPPYLQTVTSEASLKKNRNFFRNRRDFIYVTIGLAYGLNVVDAYVFAHMRSFNVSDELSMKPRLNSSMAPTGPRLTLQFDLISR